MPALAMSSTFIWKDGQKGAYQFSKALAGTIALTYGLKLAINKERPNKENNYSFPSGHTSIAFASASFVKKDMVGNTAFLPISWLDMLDIQESKQPSTLVGMC